MIHMLTHSIELQLLFPTRKRVTRSTKTCDDNKYIDCNWRHVFRPKEHKFKLAELGRIRGQPIDASGCWYLVFEHPYTININDVDWKLLSNNVYVKAGALDDMKKVLIT